MGTYPQRGTKKHSIQGILIVKVRKVLPSERRNGMGKKQHYQRKLKVLMKENDFELIRSKKHLIWKYTLLGRQIVTPVTTRNEERCLKNIRSEIGRTFTPNVEQKITPHRVI